MFPRDARLDMYDPELAKAIAAEVRRQEDHVELIASENYCSTLVMQVQGSQLTNKYAEGYSGKRYYGGCEYVDIAEQLAIERAKNCLVPIMPMCSPIAVHKPIKRCTLPCCSQAIRSSG